MKLLTVTVPCYNSQDYMEKCIESLLRGGERVEIIVIDDGSKDNTGAIGDRYAAQYPEMVKVIHQENGGHGAGINAGLKAATGKYFKVVDSDDEVFLILFSSWLVWSCATSRAVLTCSSPITIMFIPTASATAPSTTPMCCPRVGSSPGAIPSASRSTRC